ncbi:MAG: hypothetical protein ONB06_04535 [candidate division KSB1 bacterium]|nr:hypothetical protein [candidate division KSB1 bacterium]
MTAPKNGQACIAIARWEGLVAPGGEARAQELASMSPAEQCSPEGDLGSQRVCGTEVGYAPQPRRLWGLFRGYTYRWHEGKRAWVVAPGTVIVGSRDGDECSEPPGGDRSYPDGYYELDVDGCSLPGNVTLTADYLGQYAAIDVVYHPGNTQVWHNFYMLPY